MRVAIVILAVAIVGAFAQDVTTGRPECTSNSFVCFFKDLGNKIKYHAGKLGGKLAEVGKSVLNSAVQQGSKILSNGSQAALGTVLEHLNKEGLVGKRDLAFFGKLKEHVTKGKAMLEQLKGKLHTAFKAAVNKVTGIMSKTAALKEIDEDADKKIDDAVAKFGKDGKKGFFDMAKVIAGKFTEIFKAGMMKLKEKFGGKKVEERAIFGFDSLSDAWKKTKNALKGVAGGIADTFKPHLDILKTGLKTLGDKAKEHAGNLVNAAKDSFNDLSGKLSGHIDALKGHASKLGDHAVNAVNALKQALTSIASQAVGNASGVLGDIVKTGTDAAGVVSGHVAGALAGN